MSFKPKNKKEHLPTIVNGFNIRNKYSSYIPKTIIEVYSEREKIRVTWSQ